MYERKFESMWRIMKEYNLGVSENINSEYLCTICNNILIDACSAHCGCRYCKSCIADYLQDEMKSCPGDSKYCDDELINIHSDIQVDQTVNTRISRLIVNCPNTNCHTKVDIKSMGNHLEVCEHRCVSCPFFDIGCVDNALKSDKINEHLLSEVHSHTKLLMKWVNISRNETELLKNDMKQLRSENKELKERMEKTENTIRDSKKEEIKNSLEIKNLNEEITKLRKENIYLEEELQIQLNVHRKEIASYLDLKEKMEKETEEITQLKIECQQKERQLHEIIRKEIKEYIATKLDEIYLSSAAISEKSNETTQSIAVIPESIIELNFGDFEWKIEGLTDTLRQAKIEANQTIYSKPFFAFENSYKMCLGVNLNGQLCGKLKDLSIFYCIMKGPFDEILQWPFKHNVEISLMNQKTGLVHSSWVVKYSDAPYCTESFIKPISDKNVGFRLPQFIKLDEILKTSGLCENDQIVIKCRVKPL